jgi:hypothetical protein
LFRLEREKSEALEKNLTNERKENKRLEESLKAKNSILLEVEESFTSEKRKVLVFYRLPTKGYAQGGKF